MISKKYCIEDMQKLAKKRKGKCLSKKYINSKTKLKWQCSEGHVWEASFNSLQRGSWCAKCANVALKTIEDAQELAESKNGKCLSREYVNNRTKLKWQCAKGHIWSAPYRDIQQGQWCPKCAKIKLSASNRQYDIEDMHELAQKRNGECLSAGYINNRTKMKWKCNVCGNIWENSWYRVKHRKQWCSVCAMKNVGKNNKKYTIGDLRYIAAKRGGKCLSRKFTNVIAVYKWECKLGHYWQTSFHDIRRGSWCPECAMKKKKTLEEVQELAESKNGKCLSREYVNSSTKLKWQCEKGHIWSATYSSIQQGGWCPYCLYKSEQKFREVIENILELKFPKKKPKWLVNSSGNRLELDGYNEELGVAFEYQGEQHFEQASYLNDTKEKFAKRQKHDKIKKKLCKKHGVVLLCPTYKLDECDFEEFIVDTIKDTHLHNLVE